MDKKKKKKVKAHNKIDKVMAEFKAGTLRSSNGKLVTKKDQALAIATSEQERHEKYYD